MTLLTMLSIVGCTNKPSSSVPSSPVPASSSAQATSTPKPVVSTPAPVSSSSAPISTPSPVSSTPKPIEYETVIKEYYPAMYENQRFSKTSTDVTLDDMVCLAGTSNDAGSGKTISFPAGLTSKDGSTSLVSGGRFKLEGKAEYSSGIPYKKAFRFTAGGAGTLVVAAISGNSSDNTRTLTISDAEGNELETSEPCTGAVGFFTFNIPEKGNYYFYSKINGCNIYYFNLTCTVEKGVENGFTINSENCRKIFLAGESLDTTGLIVSASYTNGNDVILKPSDYKVTSDYTSATGTYTVTVTYKDYPAQTYTISSYDVTSLKVLTMGSVNYADDVKLTYHVGDTLDLSKLVVKAVLDDANSTELMIGPSTYTLDISAIDMNKIGTYNAKVSYGSLEPINVPVTVAGDLTKDNEMNNVIIIDQAGENGVNNSDGLLNFTTISGALQYLRSYKLTDAAILRIKPGVYNERFEVDLPNISLCGEGEGVVITYDAASGAEDIRGVAYGTQGSATVSIDSKATNFSGSNLKIVNSFDYDNSKLGDKQAVALVSEGDKCQFNNCVFSSFQDTLYAKVGRQQYDHCEIEGAIDFIFGNNAPVYFSYCTIRSLNRNDPENGGYITATKGSNTGNDVPKYGYVFQNCNFTAEEGVTDGSVSIGRPWGKDATVAVIDSTLGAHISKTGYGDPSVKNSRYEAMSGNLPVNAHYVEYGNTGEGAITEAVNGMTMLSLEEYQTYTKSNIFGQTNGQLTFANSWLLN